MNKTFLIILVFCKVISNYYGVNIKNPILFQEDSGLDAKFKDWFIANGGFVDKNIEISHFNEMGRGLLATSKLPSESLVLRIPSSILFSRLSLGKSKDETLINIREAFKDEIAIKIWLMYEKLKGNESNFKPYIDILPAYVPSLIHFNSNELNQLQNADFAIEVHAFQVKILEEFNHVVTIIRDFWPFPMHSITYELYKWANSIIDSRALRFKGEIFLAPLADVFNYFPHPDLRDSNAGEFFLRHHILIRGGKEIKVLSDRSVSKSNQLFEDYGDNPDEIYFKYHGFVPDQNPFRCVKIDFANVLSNDQQLNTISTSKSIAASSESNALFFMSELKMELITALQFKQPPSKCLDITGKLSKGLEVYLGVMAFNTQEVNNCLNQINRQEKRNWDAIFLNCGFSAVAEYLNQFRMGNTSVAMQNELSVGSISSSPLPARSLKVLQNVIIHTIETRYETSLVEDKRQLSLIKNDTHLTADLHKQLAVRYRMYSKSVSLKLCELYGIFNTCDSKIGYGAIAIEPRNENLLGQIEVDADSNENDKELSQEVDDFKQQLIVMIDAFNRWFEDNNPNPNKLRAEYIPGFRIGTTATCIIGFEEEYLGVPSDIIMDSDVAFSPSSSVSALITALWTKYNRRDDFHELLFFLIHERFVKKETSFYWPYLALLPNLEDMIGLPMFWTKQQIKSLLGASYLSSVVLSYQDRTYNTYKSVKKIELVDKFFPDDILVYKNYQWATAILDSRSIWWNGKRHLVPMLDFVNCREDEEQPARVHSTQFERERGVAITKSGRSYETGDQVFENYGQPNHIYFMYHGFSLFDYSKYLQILQNDSIHFKNGIQVLNTHDCVHWELELTGPEMKRIDKIEKTIHITKRLNLPDLSSYIKESTMDDSLSSIEPIVYHHCLSSESMHFDAKKGGASISNLWLLLSLKANQFEKQLEEKTLGYPTKESAQLLLEQVNERLSRYRRWASEMSTHHEMGTKEFIIQSAQKFIASEYFTLMSVQSSILSYLESLIETKQENQFQHEL